MTDYNQGGYPPDLPPKTSPTEPTQSTRPSAPQLEPTPPQPPLPDRKEVIVKDKGNRRLVWIIVIAAAILLLGGIFLYLRNRQSSVNLPQVTEEPRVSEIQEYPDIYKAAKLPEYPGGDVTSVGRKDISIEEGASVFVITKDDLKKVSEFYESELAKLGWQVDSEFPQQIAEDFYYKSFKKDDTQFSVTISRTNNETNVSIGYVKR